MLSQLSPDIGSNVQVLKLCGCGQARAVRTGGNRNSGTDLDLIGIVGRKDHGVMAGVYVFPVSHFIEGKVQTIGLHRLNLRRLPFRGVCFRFILGPSRTQATSHSNGDYSNE